MEFINIKISLKAILFFYTVLICWNNDPYKHPVILFFELSNLYLYGKIMILSFIYKIKIIVLYSIIF